MYLGSANGKYKFMLSGVVAGWVKEDEVQVVNLSQVKAVSCYEVKDGKLLHHIVQDMTTPGYATSLNNGSGAMIFRTRYMYITAMMDIIFIHIMVLWYRITVQTSAQIL